jgi:hypothetical protein
MRYLHRRLTAHYSDPAPRGRAGECNAARAPVEQAGTQVCLQARDRARHERSRDVEVAGGGSEATFLGDADEYPHALQCVHLSIEAWL